MSTAEHATLAVAEEDMFRAQFYALLASLLARPPSQANLDALKAVTGDASVLGHAVDRLAAAASEADEAQVVDEFNRLFIGLTEGDLRPYGSYYLTGFLYEKPLADLRHDLEVLGIAQAEGVAEPEDHIASLCDVMQALITGSCGPPADLACQRRFFGAHIAPWAGAFFSDLETADNAVFYRPVGTIGRLLIAVEMEAFAMA